MANTNNFIYIMRKIKHIILAVIATIAVAMPASAQFRFGIKAGMNVNSVSFNTDNLKNNFNKENRSGFFGGITTEFTVPIIGIGFDLSVLYSHRNIAGEVTGNNDLASILKNDDFRKQDYIEIPLNLKYKLGLPAIGKIVTPYLTTGPSIAFKCSKAAVTDAYKEKKFDAAWNVGGGIQLIEHLQIGVNYSWGMTKALEYIVKDSEAADLGKINGWKISAAWFF